VVEVLKLGPRTPVAIVANAAKNCDPLAQSGLDQGGNRSVPKKEREIHGVKFRVVNSVFYHP
jgi:hypothetical protein